MTIPTLTSPPGSAALPTARLPRWATPDGLQHNNLDFLRFTLATLVIFFHAFHLVARSHDDPLAILTGQQLNFGSVAVNGFFVISGFLITHSFLHSPTTLAFLKRRTLRIYPGFAVAVLVCAFIVTPLALTHPAPAFSPAQMRSLLPGIALLRGYNCLDAFAANPYPHEINGSLWSIPFEFWCYLGVALTDLLGLLRPSRRFVLLLLFALSLPISYIFVARHLIVCGSILGTIFGYPVFWARLLPYFLSGMVFYLLRQHLPDRWPAPLAAAALLILARFTPLGLTWAAPIAATYLLFWIAFHPRIPLHRWARYGDFSYGMYLYAFPIQQFLILYIPWAIHPLYQFALAWPLSILAGALSWHLIEKHFLRRKTPV